MKLNIEQLKKISLGAESVIETEKGIEFDRFNSEERDVYSVSTIEARTHSPAGAELLFKTDAKSIYIKLDAEKTLDRTFFCIDILENGKLAGNIKNFEEEHMTGFYSWDEYPLGSFEGSVEFGDGEKEIRIVLPWSVRCFFKEINLEGATYINPVKKEKTILFYGDSITHGYDSAHPLNTYAKRVADGLCAEGFVKAVGGECFLPDLAKVNGGHNPDYVVVAYGTNDWTRNNKEQFDKDSKEFINTISANYPHAKIFVLTPIWRKDSVKETDSFGDIFYVGKHLADICDGLKNVHLIDGWNLVSHNENLYGDLRLHPNDNGFGEYAKSLLAEIKEYI
ncbi:MAG: SGNH/GDSL hydrolase family protein [Clostridia bacterium]|nr:SGNH/GDSL hydrolase family protein [Clostridia bacterium]